MVSFPRTELDVIGLALEMKAGLTAHAEVFPEPPVPATEMTTILDQFAVLMETLTTARSNAEALTNQKIEMLESIVGKVKSNLKYAELVTGGSDEKLKLIGWGAKKPPTPLELPGQPRNLAAYPQPEGTVELQWMIPAEGGKVAMYTLRRRQAIDEPWTDVHSCLDRQAKLTKQPTGVKLEYCVIASNKTGDGQESNTVAVVL